MEGKRRAAVRQCPCFGRITQLFCLVTGCHAEMQVLLQGRGDLLEALWEKKGAGGKPPLFALTILQGLAKNFLFLIY